MSTKKQTKKQSKAAKALRKALEELEQESASLQILGRALTPEEQARVKALARAIQLVTRALRAVE
jgi:hypothetical protein